MQQNEKNGWQIFMLLLGTIALAAAGICIVFRLERRLLQLCRAVRERLTLRSSRFETNF